MGQQLNIKVRGVYTYPSDLSEVPQGALARGDEIIVDRESIAEPRRGFGYLTDDTGARIDFPRMGRANKYFFYQNQTLAHYTDEDGDQWLAYVDPATGWVDYSGQILPPLPTVRMRAAQANQNLYLTASSGVKKLDAYNAQPRPIGVPPALDLISTIAATVTPTGTTANSSNQITAVSSVAGVAIGMQVAGSNIPAGTYITSFNANTITISNNATGSGSGITLTISAPATFLASGDQGNTTAYRLLWSITDVNQNLILGAPSQSSQVVNTTAAEAAVINTFTIPDGITTAHKYQLYRSLSVDAGITPNDEGQLCYEGSVSAADILYGVISVLDIVPDALLGATIYTAQSQEGLAQANTPVPFALDISTFRETMFFANTSTLEQYNLTLLGVGTPNGIRSGDTITIAGVTYTGAATENAATGQFKITQAFSLATTGTTSNGSNQITSVAVTTGIEAGQLIAGLNIPAGTYVVSIVGTTVTMSQNANGTNSGLLFRGASASQAIRDTALSLCRVVNRYASSVVYAYYISGPTDLPGRMLFTGIDESVSQFAVTSSRGTCWNPALPSSGTAQQSTDNDNPNYVYFSKNQQPEAVPLANYLPVGSAAKAILRIIALRDALFVLKEDGAFYITGTDSTNFEVYPLDYTAILIAPESAVALNNQIYCLTTQGVVSISQNGVSIMSRAIEGDLLELISYNYGQLQQQSFGVSYESARAYYLFCITNGADTVPTQYWRYNYITDNWTHSNMSKRCGAVNPLDDKLYLGNVSRPITDVENKNYAYTDYADYQSTLKITAVVDQTVTIEESDTIEIGSIIWQSSSVYGVVESINTLTDTVTTTLPTDLLPEFTSSGITARLVMGSTRLYELSSIANLRVGQTVSGTGIAANTEVSGIFGSSAISGVLGDTVNGSANITNISDMLGLESGLTVVGVGIPDGTVIISVGTNSITISNAATADGVGVSLDFSPSVEISLAATADSASEVVTFSATGFADILAPIRTGIEWVPITFGNPGIAHQAREVDLIFREGFNGPATTTFSSDFYPSEEVEPLDGGSIGVWGLFAWGGPDETPQGVFWGGDPLRGNVRVLVTRNHQRCSQLYVGYDHAWAYSPWKLQGISIQGNNLTERTSNN